MILLQQYKNVLQNLQRVQDYLLLVEDQRCKQWLLHSLKPKEAAIVGALLQGGPDSPKARTYDSKTGKVTEIFEKLERDSKDKLNEIKLLEQNASNDHKLAVAALNGEHKSMDTLVQDKTKQKGAAQDAHDNARKAQNDAKKALADFTQYHTNV